MKYDTGDERTSKQALPECVRFSHPLFSGEWLKQSFSLYLCGFWDVGMINDLSDLTYKIA